MSSISTSIDTYRKCIFEKIQVKINDRYSTYITTSYKHHLQSRGSLIGFFGGSGISLTSGSGFGILKQNRGEIRDWKFAREMRCQNQPSGLRD